MNKAEVDAQATEVARIVDKNVSAMAGEMAQRDGPSSSFNLSPHSHTPRGDTAGRAVRHHSRRSRGRLEG